MESGSKLPQSKCRRVTLKSAGAYPSGKPAPRRSLVRSQTYGLLLRRLVESGQRGRRGFRGFLRWETGNLLAAKSARTGVNRQIPEIRGAVLIWNLRRREEGHEEETKGDHGFLDVTDHPGRRDANKAGCPWPAVRGQPRLLDHG